MIELFNSLCSGLAPEKGGTPLLSAATSQLSLICYKRFTYFPFFHFLSVVVGAGWGGEGRKNTQINLCFQELKQKNLTSNLFSNVLLWDFVVIFPVLESVGVLHNKTSGSKGSRTA